MELDREEILKALKRVPGGKPVDALDLWGVSEFKVNSAGTVEVKFADRVKAIGLLLECAGGGEDGMNALLKALEAGEE